MTADARAMTELFLAGADVVLAAVSDALVGEAWDQPSVLAEQRVGGLAGHLARGGVWAVGEYLAGGDPVGPAQVASAGDYFALLADAGTEQDHRAIRERGASVAAVGQRGVVITLRERLAELRLDLPRRPEDQLVAVIGGTVMRLGDYLATRIVEQTVHLDDLARSLDRPGWSLPAGAEALTLSIGLDVGRRRAGAAAMVRALYRSGFAESVLPVLS
ncbi:MAG: hypothetical protein JWN46_1064 [Acidimicrobiales bacterium]|nr:hypothetical protein [Acidimicrobiales bacterium]